MAQLPRSVARWYDPFLTIGASIFIFLTLRDTTISNVNFVLALVAGSTFFMLLCEWMRARQTLPARTPAFSEDLWRRVAIKWLGVMTVLFATLALWYVIPFYSFPRYQPLFSLQPILLPWIALLLIPYIAYSEWRLGHVRDYAWWVGLLVSGNIKEMDWSAVRDAALSMLVRTIFLPLNFCYMTDVMPRLRTTDWQLMFGAPTPESHFIIMQCLYALLIVAIIPGYIFTFRLFNTHTRAIDRSWFGWIVTMSCYPPLNSGVFSAWFAYNPFRFEEPFMKPWIHLFSTIEPLVYAIGIGIILSEIVHLWGEAMLGIRASNLSHRGVITNGCFRHMRHPIYFSKCVGWFLIACPFAMGENGLHSLHLTFLFCGVCFVYYLRSIAEEKMLSVDPDYVAYALWVDKHGLLAWWGRKFPVLTFAWRHEHWHTKVTPGSTMRNY